MLDKFPDLFLPELVKMARSTPRAGKRVREDFMNFVWINDVLIAGARQLLDVVPADPRKGSARAVAMVTSGGSADD